MTGTDRDDPFKRFREMPESKTRQKLASRLRQQSKMMPEIEGFAFTMHSINGKFSKLSSEERRLEIEILRNLLATCRSGGLQNLPISLSGFIEDAVELVERLLTKMVDGEVQDFIAFLENVECDGSDEPDAEERAVMIAKAKEELRLLHEEGEAP